MSSPAEPNSDGWTTFVKQPDGLFHRINQDRFLLPEDARPGDRIFQPEAINYCPPQLKFKKQIGDAGLLDAIVNRGWDYLSKEHQPDPKASGEKCDGTPACTPNSSTKAEAAGSKKIINLANGLFDTIGVTIAASKGRFDPEIRELYHRSQEGADCSDLSRLFGMKPPKPLFEGPEYEIAKNAQKMCTLIRQGDVRAAQRYLEILTVLIEQLQHLEKDAPEAFHELLRWRIRWPAFLSKHPHYNNLGSLPAKLAHGYPFILDGACRWDPENDITRVAIHLLLYVYRMQLALKGFCGETRVGRSGLDPKLTAFLDLGELPDAAPDWWEVAYLAFLETYPHPENGGRFSNWVTGKSHTRSPGRKRERIREKLRDGFFSVAGHNKSRRAGSG